jgi:hypothetical protein
MQSTRRLTATTTARPCNEGQVIPHGCRPALPPQEGDFDSGAPRKPPGAVWPLAGVTPLASRNNASRVTPELPRRREQQTRLSSLFYSFVDARSPGQSKHPAARPRLPFLTGRNVL